MKPPAKPQNRGPRDPTATHTTGRLHARYRKGASGIAEILAFGRWKPTIYPNEALDKLPFKPIKKETSE